MGSYLHKFGVAHGVAYALTVQHRFLHGNSFSVFKGWEHSLPGPLQGSDWKGKMPLAGKSEESKELNERPAVDGIHGTKPLELSPQGDSSSRYLPSVGEDFFICLAFPQQSLIPDHCLSAVFMSLCCDLDGPG